MATISQYGDNLSLNAYVPDVNIVEVPPQVIIEGAPSTRIGAVGVGSWGKANVPITVSGVADATPAIGAVTVRKFDLCTLVAIAQPQGASDFRVVRVTDGTDTAAVFVLPAADLAASPTFLAALAAAVNDGQGVLRGASQLVSIDPVAGIVSALCTGTRGNGIVVSVGPGSKAGTYRGVVRVAGAQPEIYDNLPGATPPTSASYSLAGGTDGAAGITSAQLVGADTSPPTGIYSLRGQGCSAVVVADLDDPTQWTTVTAFAQSEAAYAINQVAFGTAIPAAVALKSGEGFDSRFGKLMHGDALFWVDNVNGLVRLASPSSFAAAKIAALQPNQSPLNKALVGIVGSQRSGSPGSGATGRYSRAELAQLSQAGIDVITNPAPAGAIWAVRIGHNTSSNPAVHQDASTTMNNFIATSLAAVMGLYDGEPISSDLLLAISATLNAFGASMLRQGLLGNPGGGVPYFVLCDASNNPAADTGVGFVRASFRVRTQAILEDFEIDLEDGPTVTLGSTAA